MATHSSILKWEISQTEEPVRLRFKIVRYDLVTKQQHMKNKFVTTQKKTQENRFPILRYKLEI